MIYFRPKLYHAKSSERVWSTAPMVSETLCIRRPLPSRLARIARFKGRYRAVRETLIPFVYVATGDWHMDFHDYYERTESAK